MAELRASIAQAAVECGYERLQTQAQSGGGPFTFTFGGGDDPAQYWRDEEAAGGEPLRFLVELLDRPYVRTSVGGDEVYVSPSAAMFDSWREVPVEDRETLRPLYRDDDFELFEQLGAYIGYRVSITGDGERLYFVAGD